MDIGSKGYELWAKYVLSQIIRTPTNVNRIKNEYSEISESIVLEVITNAATDHRALLNLRSLTWVVGYLSCDQQLITSDNPTIFEPQDLSRPDCYIVMPLSPKHFFLATREENLDRFPSDPEEMVKFINGYIYRSASKRIIACEPSKVVGLERA